MKPDSRTRFDVGAEAWAEYNQKPLGRIRQEVTWHNLAPNLLDVMDPDCRPRVLDVGGGSGELALRLALHGYSVWLSDYAPAMLGRARQAAQELPDDVRARITFCYLSADETAETFTPKFFDAITCHTLIEFLPDPHASLGALVGLLRDGGVLSVSFVNQHAEVLRHVWSRSDPLAALATLENGCFCATLFDIPGVAYSAESVGAWLCEMGLNVTGLYGIRVFADYVPRERLDDPDFFDALLRLEKAVAARPPYNELARYVQLVAHKPRKFSRVDSCAECD